MGERVNPWKKKSIQNAKRPNLPPTSNPSSSKRQSSSGVVLVIRKSLPWGCLVSPNVTPKRVSPSKNGGNHLVIQENWRNCICFFKVKWRFKNGLIRSLIFFLFSGIIYSWMFQELDTRIWWNKSHFLGDSLRCKPRALCVGKKKIWDCIGSILKKLVLSVGLDKLRIAIRHQQASGFVYALKKAWLLFKKEW